MAKLLTPALLVLATCLFLPTTGISATNNLTIQKDKDLISKSREGDVLKSEDQILSSALDDSRI